MFITPSFKKSLIVEQFQGNYLKLFETDNVTIIMIFLKHKSKMAMARDRFVFKFLQRSVH